MNEYKDVERMSVMRNYCFICGRKVDTIGYYVDSEDGFICESCASKCSLSTQNTFHTKTKSELIKEIEKHELSEATKRPDPVEKKRIKGVNRLAWIALAIVALMYLLMNVLYPAANKKSAPNEAHSTTVISANISTDYPQNLSTNFLIY